MTFHITENENGLDYEEEILQYIDSNPTGVTIADINKNLNFARNTITKYLSILEAKNQVQFKKWGRNKVYQSTDRSVIPRKFIQSFIKGAFLSLKKKFPKIDAFIKDMGKDISNFMFESLEGSLLDELSSMKEQDDTLSILKSFEQFYPNFDFFQDEFTINLIKLDIPKKYAEYRFKDSEFIGSTEDYIYYFHAMCGVLEGFAKKFFKSEIECNVIETHISKNEKESYVDISIQLKE